MISLTDVSYAYPDAEALTLEHVDLEVERGSIAGIVGASGAGKTTLAKIIAGFIPHADGGELSGTVRVDGRDLSTGSLVDAVSVVGLVIQNPFNQISGAKYTVREEIAFGLENFGTPRDEMQRRVDEVAALLRIEHLLDRSPYALSGGQQQLVAIASMIVLRTPVIVMDEPTAQLDPAGTRMVFDVLSALRETGITIVIFEHKLELLQQHADRLHVVADRSIVLSGAPDDVLADDRLAQWAVGTTRYVTAGRLARERGLLPPEVPLPVSFEQAERVFDRERSVR
ncbi:energy-coupling factor ABC transporter ATP-binding protein [Ruicaihuangia caeni]|uniref:ABC transporter ATP-binding protein n=1 Tax=Ruicaihuangia caeni TaxID=3042517 RepID=A0AAW6TBF9_9MICO|nr:ABC transporter ATP-binding protein [Klugiella sp. YN-L-19]MDI2099293.1 ABC transporter ATP-binding protein [Klugiella sp. YN-L-19]